MDAPILSANDGGFEKYTAGQDDEEPVMHGEPVLMIPQNVYPQSAAAQQAEDYPFNPQD